MASSSSYCSYKAFTRPISVSAPSSSVTLPPVAASASPASTQSGSAQSSSSSPCAAGTDATRPLIPKRPGSGIFRSLAQEDDNKEYDLSDSQRDQRYFVLPKPFLQFVLQLIEPALTTTTGSHRMLLYVQQSFLHRFGLLFQFGNLLLIDA